MAEIEQEAPAGMPTLQLTKKYLQVPAPPSSAVPVLRAAFTAALRHLQAHEQFVMDADDRDATNTAREASYVLHSLLESLRGVSMMNLKEYQAWQEAVAEWQRGRGSGIHYAAAASPAPQEDGTSEDED